MKSFVEGLQLQKNWKRIGMVAVLILSVLVLVLGMRIAVRAVDIQEVAFVQGSDGAYEVSTAEQIMALGKAMSSETADKTFKLVNDIEVTGAITSAAKGEFAGTLDGNGYLITYSGDINIQENVDGSLVDHTINSGILFGKVTGVVENLFLSFADTSMEYTFQNTAQLESTGGTVTLADYSGEVLSNTSDADRIIAALSNSANRYVLEGNEYVLDENASISYPQGSDTKTYYYGQSLEVAVSKTTEVWEVNGNPVSFGTICGENAGTIRNVELRGSTLKATSVDDAYTRSDTYTDKTADIMVYYGVTLAKDSTADTMANTTSAVNRYTYLYRVTENEGTYAYDYATPLYQAKADGTLDIEAPLYTKVYENDTWMWDLGTKGKTPVSTDEELLLGLKEQLALTSKDTVTEGKYNYLYLYDASGVYDLTKPLYDADSNAIYTKFTQNGTDYFYLTRTVESISNTALTEILPCKGSGAAETVASTQLDGGSNYNLYIAMADGTYRPLYAQKEDGSFDLTESGWIYEKKDANHWDLTKLKGGATSDITAEQIRATSTEMSVTSANAQTIRVKTTQGLYVYAYTQVDGVKNYDLSKPLYGAGLLIGTPSNPTYLKLTDAQGVEYFDLTKAPDADLGTNKLAVSITTSGIEYMDTASVSTLTRYNYASFDNVFDKAIPLYQGDAAIYLEVMDQTRGSYFDLTRLADGEASSLARVIPATEVPKYTTGSITDAACISYTVAAGIQTEPEQAELEAMFDGEEVTEYTTYESGNTPQLILGGVAGTQTSGAITGIIQNLSVVAERGVTESGSDHAAMSISVGAAAGDAKGDLTDILIKGTVTAPEHSNCGSIAGKSTDAAITDCILQNADTKVYGSGTATMEYCFSNATGAQSSGLIDLSDFATTQTGDVLTGWQVLDKDMTGRDTTEYLPVWLCRGTDDITFTYGSNPATTGGVRTYTIASPNTARISVSWEKNAAAQEPNIPLTTLRTRYQYLTQGRNNELSTSENVVNTGVNSTASGEALASIGNSGQMTVTDVYATDGRFHYITTGTEELYYQEAYVQPVEKYVVENNGSATAPEDYVVVYNDAIPETATQVELFYTSSGESTYTAAPAVTYNSDQSRWETRILFEDETMTLNTYWKVTTGDGTFVYPVSADKELAATDHTAVTLRGEVFAVNGELHNVTYSNYDEATDQYLSTVESDDIAGITLLRSGETEVEEGFTLRLQDSHEGEGVSYSYLFSETEENISSQEQIESLYADHQSKIQLFTGNIRIPDANQRYLYVFEKYKNLRVSVQQYVLTIDTAKNYVPDFQETPEYNETEDRDYIVVDYNYRDKSRPVPSVVSMGTEGFGANVRITTRVTLVYYIDGATQSHRAEVEKIDDGRGTVDSIQYQVRIPYNVAAMSLSGYWEIQTETISTMYDPFNYNITSRTKEVETEKSLQTLAVTYEASDHSAAPVKEALAGMNSYLITEYDTSAGTVTGEYDYTPITEETPAFYAEQPLTVLDVPAGVAYKYCFRDSKLSQTTLSDRQQIDALYEDPSTRLCADGMNVPADYTDGTYYLYLFEKRTDTDGDPLPYLSIGIREVSFTIGNGDRYKPHFIENDLAQIEFDTSTDTEYIPVRSSAEFAEGRSVAFLMYTTDGVNRSMEDLVELGKTWIKTNGSNSSELKSVVAFKNSSSGLLEGRIPYTKDEMVIQAFWLVLENNDAFRLYIPTTAPTYNQHNTVNVKTQIQTWQYDVLTGEDTLTPYHANYNEASGEPVEFCQDASIRLTELHTSGAQYYYQFSENEIDYSDASDVPNLTTLGSAPYTSFVGTSVIDIPSGYQKGDTGYLYIYEKKDGLKIGVKEYQFTVRGDDDFLPQFAATPTYNREESMDYVKVSSIKNVLPAGSEIKVKLLYCTDPTAATPTYQEMDAAYSAADGTWSCMIPYPDPELHIMGYWQVTRINERRLYSKGISDWADYTNHSEVELKGTIQTVDYYLNP